MRKLLPLLFLARSVSADEPPKLEELQKEYERIRASLFTARARAAALSSTLYSAKLQLYLHYTTPRFFHVGRAIVRLDGATVFDDTSSAIGTDDVLRWSGYVAPGQHAVTIRVDADTKDDPSFTTSSESTFIVDVPPKKEVTVRAQAEDGGDLGSSWKAKGRGSYRLHLDIDVEARDVAAR